MNIVLSKRSLLPLDEIDFENKKVEIGFSSCGLREGVDVDDSGFIYRSIKFICGDRGSPFRIKKVSDGRYTIWTEHVRPTDKKLMECPLFWTTMGAAMRPEIEFRYCDQPVDLMDARFWIRRTSKGMFNIGIDDDHESGSDGYALSWMREFKGSYEWAFFRPIDAKKGERGIDAFWITDYDTDY